MNAKRVLITVLLGLIIISAGTAIFFQLTTKMSNPTTVYESSKDIKMANASDYDNSILLYKDKAVLTIGQDKIETHYDSVEQIISSKIDQVKTKEFNIIATKETEYKTIVYVLDIMAIKRIKRYKLLKS